MIPINIGIYVSDIDLSIQKRYQLSDKRLSAEAFLALLPAFEVTEDNKILLPLGWESSILSFSIPDR